MLQTTMMQAKNSKILPLRSFVRESIISVSAVLLSIGPPASGIFRPDHDGWLVSPSGMYGNRDFVADRTAGSVCAIQSPIKNGRVSPGRRVSWWRARLALERFFDPVERFHRRQDLMHRAIRLAVFFDCGDELAVNQLDAVV